ncbi:Heavy-metal-associated domain protein [Pseudobythopirellula maris]|uniref:Heavy-metal-associated domain protein n=1 Tax=Pseudobythopirellula maris TaxID=2527991 RepID=A0A5C5ZJL8_9BACT|nr:heavy-metal-associated domain-containing protein [Pseudobythopirellula maris]TWT87594.1 Heavy-metal-associated domain protein [Pseudobythopirellula maris]
MKRLLLAPIAAVVCLVVGCGGAPETATTEVFNAEGAPTVEIAAGNMTCQGCASGVRRLLAEEPGVVDVRVELERLVAIVAYDTSMFDASAARETLVEAGYAGGDGAETDEPAVDADETEAVDAAAEGEEADSAETDSAETDAAASGV